MNGVLLGMLGGCGALGVYTYAGYPAALWMLGRRRRVAVSAPPPEWPPITIVIPAYNEEESIERTLLQILEADYPVDRRQILVVSDASTDGTDAIVRSFADRGVELVRMSSRGGKTRNENAVLPLLRGEIIVNTDASVRVHPGAIKALVAAMTDSSVGVASGRDVSVGAGEEDGRTGERAYVGYEMWVRDLETRLGGIVGASGCLYAMRAALHRRKIRDDLSRDFASAMTAREAGYRAVSVPDAICYVARTSSLHQEYRRKVRTIDRGISTLANRFGMLNPFRFGVFAWMLFSHKLCRWLVPWALLLATITLVLLAGNDSWARWLVGGGLVVGAAAAVGWWWPEHRSLPRLLAIPTFAVFGNIAVIHAWIRGATGRGTPVWEPTRRSAGTTAA